MKQSTSTQTKNTHNVEHIIIGMEEHINLKRVQLQPKTRGEIEPTKAVWKQPPFWIIY